MSTPEGAKPRASDHYREVHEPLAGKFHEQVKSESDSLEKLTAQLAEKDKKIADLRQLLKDECEQDRLIRDSARPFLGEFQTDGDSYGVPTPADVVESLARELAAAKERIELLERTEELLIKTCNSFSKPA